jgi:hypothetical protein
MPSLPAERKKGNGGDPPRLLPQHLADLRASGLSDAQIAACGFYSEPDPAAVATLLGWTKPARALGPCLCLPFVGPDGKPTAYVRVKPDRPRDKDGKTVKYESPLRKPNRAYVPPATRAVLTDPGVPLLVTEGEKKAAKADQDGFPCIGLVGVYGWQKKRPTGADGKKAGARELIADLAAVAWGGRAVTVVYDSDLADKPEVAWAEWHLSEALPGATVRAVRLPPGPNGEKVGLDDYLAAHGADALRNLIDAATPPTRPAVDDDRPAIVLGADEFRVNAEAVDALAQEPDLYQRGGMLVQVVKSDPVADPSAAVRRPPDSPVVRDLPPPLLRDRLTRCARWVKLVRGEGGVAKVCPAHPPAWSVNAVHARGTWPGVRHLEAVINHPVLLPDGSILTANGYDPTSGLLVSIPADLRVSVPDRPTRQDVRAAVATLADVLTDFPFERPAHRAAWFPGLLTPLAWFAFEGSAPLLLIDGNVRGVGKGLLADVIALTLTGRRFPVMSYTPDREELRKKITALAMEGERLVLLDNLAGGVGNDVLDRALTADRWKDQVLGGNRVYDGLLHVCWYATGNNVQLHGDTSRRCSHCRLESPEERPELLSAFRYPDLRRHVRQQRGPLLSAALTILRGWGAAGRPQHGLPPWGSFEGWSAVVREAVVFAGLPDPGETRLALQTMADRDALAMTALIDALVRMDCGRRGVTTAEIIDAIRKPADPPPEWYADLKSAVEELCGKLDGRALGYRFRQFKRRNFGGRMLDTAGEDRDHGNRWVVAAVTNSIRPKPSPASPALPADGPVVGGDAGHAGDVPAQSEMPSPNGTLGRRRFGNNDTAHVRR